MKIEIWSDYVCPFCYIGIHNFERALNQFPQKDNVEVVFKSYQLDPNTPPYSGQDFYESMAPKFGGVEKSKQMMAGIVEQAKTVGLDFNFDTMKPTNTLNAHRLTKYARKHDKEKEVSEKLFYANFTESKDIGHIETLGEIAAEVGLDKDETLTFLNDQHNFVNEVNEDIEEAKQYGITSVPTFIFNRKFALSGGQSTRISNLWITRCYPQVKI